MIKLENTFVSGWEAAIRGMRNPLNSWARSDTIWGEYHGTDMDGHEIIDHYFTPIIGENDHKLMMKLVKAGKEHAKFRRMINVTMDVTCHSVWWQEFDTYKVGTVRNSCSKMHKIHAKKFEKDDFSHEGIDEVGFYTVTLFDSIIDGLEKLRLKYNETHDVKYWRAIIEMLPAGYNLKATIQLNYEVLAGIYKQRKAHKLDEWHTFCDWIESLPYSELITGGENNV